MGWRKGLSVSAILIVNLTVLFTIGINSSGQIQIPDLTVTEEIAIGEQLLITLYAKGNITIAVSSPTGTQFSDALFWLTENLGSWAIPVTKEWGFGKGRVEATMADAGNTTTLLRTFEIVCPSTCLIDIMNEGVEKAFRFVWIIAAIILILGLMFIGHAAHVYKVDKGELSWVEHLILLTKTALKRDPFQRLWKDQTGSLPEGLRENLDNMNETAQKLKELEIQTKDADRYARLKAAEVLARSDRLGKAIQRIERMASDLDGAELSDAENRFSGAKIHPSRGGNPVLKFAAGAISAILGLGLFLSVNHLLGYPFESLRGFLWEPWMQTIPDSLKFIAGIPILVGLLGYLILARGRRLRGHDARRDSTMGEPSAVKVSSNPGRKPAETLAANPAPRFKCEECGKSFGSRLGLQSHQGQLHKKGGN